MDLGGVRALVVLPELPVAGGAVGGAPASVLLGELDDCRVLPVESFVPLDESFVLPVGSLVRELVVSPEFAPVEGLSVELLADALEALPELLAVLFDFLLLAVPVLASPAGGVSPVPGVALAEGSAAALFFGLVVAVGVVFAFSPSVLAALSVLVLDLLFEEVVEVPELLLVLSVPAAVSFESLFFLVVVFFEVVEVSPGLACGDFVESVESAAAGFFFFFFAAVESLCDWSVACVDWREALPCVVLTRPKPSNAVKPEINIAKRKFLFMAVARTLLESSFVLLNSRKTGR